MIKLPVSLFLAALVLPSVAWAQSPKAMVLQDHPGVELLFKAPLRENAYSLVQGYVQLLSDDTIALTGADYVNNIDGISLYRLRHDGQKLWERFLPFDRPGYFDRALRAMEEGRLPVLRAAKNHLKKDGPLSADDFAAGDYDHIATRPPGRPIIVAAYGRDSGSVAGKISDIAIANPLFGIWRLNKEGEILWHRDPLEDLRLQSVTSVAAGPAQDVLWVGGIGLDEAAAPCGRPVLLTLDKDGHVAQRWEGEGLNEFRAVVAVEALEDGKAMGIVGFGVGRLYWEGLNEDATDCVKLHAPRQTKMIIVDQKAQLLSAAEFSNGLCDEPKGQPPATYFSVRGEQVGIDEKYIFGCDYLDGVNRSELRRLADGRILFFDGLHYKLFDASGRLIRSRQFRLATMINYTYDFCLYRTGGLSYGPGFPSYFWAMGEEPHSAPPLCEMLYRGIKPGRYYDDSNNIYLPNYDPSDRIFLFRMDDEGGMRFPKQLIGYGDSYDWDDMRHDLYWSDGSELYRYHMK